MTYKTKMIRYIEVLAVLLTVLPVLSGCFFGTTVANTVTPTIRAVGLPAASVIDSVTLKVTAPDMDPVEISYSELPNVINIAIPEGTDRTFELSVNLSSTFTANPAITYTSFKGTATANISSDSAVVTLNMKIGSTKLIVPDMNNNRLVQIDDISGAGWKTLKGSQMVVFDNVDSNFQPFDVDFDQYGNIFVANIASNYTGIYRFTSINDTTPVPVLKPLTTSWMAAVALDRTNNRIYGVYYDVGTGYYTVIYSSYMGNLTGGTQFYQTNDPLDMVGGIYIDDTGNVYLCGSFNSQGWINKYSPSGTLLVSTSVFTGNDAVSDITIIDGILYASISYDTSTARIDAFDPDTLQLISGTNTYGSYSDSPSIASQFFGPHNFIATLNDKITVMDFDPYNGIGSRIISFDDILGNNWTPYGSLDTNYQSEGFFMFQQGEQ